MDVNEQDSALAVVEKAIKKHLRFFPQSNINFNKAKLDMAFAVYTAIKEWNEQGDELNEETLRKPIFNELELTKMKEESHSADKLKSLIRMDLIHSDENNTLTSKDNDNLRVNRNTLLDHDHDQEERNGTNLNVMGFRSSNSFNLEKAVKEYNNKTHKTSTATTKHNRNRLINHVTSYNNTVNIDNNNDYDNDSDNGQQHDTEQRINSQHEHMENTKDSMSSFERNEMLTNQDPQLLINQHQS